VFGQRKHRVGLSYLLLEMGIRVWKVYSVKLCRLSKVINHVFQEIKKERHFYHRENGMTPLLCDWTVGYSSQL
jgi:hypothetical protein